MVFMTRKSEALLDRLVRLAGSAELVEQALRDLSGNPKPPTLEELIRRIIEIRAGRGCLPFLQIRKRSSRGNTCR